MASSSGAQGALGLIVLLALLVAGMQVMDLVTDEWRRDYSIVWLGLAGVAGVAVLDLVRAKRREREKLRRKKRKELVKESLQKFVGEFVDFIANSDKKAFLFKDKDWQREAERWLTAHKKYSDSPELTEWLASAARRTYWLELTEGAHDGPRHLTPPGSVP